MPGSELGLDFGFRFGGLGFRVSGFRFRGLSLDFRVSGFGLRFRVSGLGFRVLGFRFWRLLGSPRSRGADEVEYVGLKTPLPVIFGRERFLY